MEHGLSKIIPISLGMVNTYLVKGQSNILIDTGLSGKENKIVQEMKKHGVEPKDISLIVVTHNHTDHVGGLKKMKELTGAKVLIHTAEAKALEQGESTKVNPVTLFGSVISKFFGSPHFEGVKADIFMENELDLDEFGISGKLIHTPGHTPGSISLFLENGEMIVGDLFSCKGSKASKPIFATDLQELKNTLQSIVALEPATIYTSHGTSCNLAPLKKLIAQL